MGVGKMKKGIWLCLAIFAALPVEAATVKIGALVSGQVIKVYVKPGQKVVKGQKLLEIDDAAFQAEVAAADARLAQAELKLADAKVELDKQLDLFDRTVTAKRALDKAQLAYDLLQQQVKMLTAQLNAKKAWQKYYHLVAPRKGRVAKIYAPVGSTVYLENTPLLDLEVKE